MWPFKSVPHDQQGQYFDPRVLDHELYGGWESGQSQLQGPRVRAQSGIGDVQETPFARRSPDLTQDNIDAHPRQELRPGASSRSFAFDPGARDFVPRQASEKQWPPVRQEEVVTQRREFDAPPTLPTVRVVNAPEQHEQLGAPLSRTHSSRGRASRRGSPGRRPSQNRMRPGTSSFRLSSPVRSTREVMFNNPLHWIQKNAYHLGDRTAFVRNHHVPIINTPRQPVSRPTSVTSPSSNRNHGPFWCDINICEEQDERFVTLSDLRHHQRKHMSEDQRPYVCPSDGKRFLYPKDLRRHMSSKSHGGQPIQCPECGKWLHRADNFQRHLADQHGMTRSPSNNSALSVGSPSSPSLSTMSEAAYSHTSPSTALSPTWSPVRTGSHAFQRVLPRVNEWDDPFIDGPSGNAATSAAMARWHTH